LKRNSLPGIRGGEGGGAQGTARPAKFNPYKSWCCQLAAYRAALPTSPGFGATSGEPVRCVNLIVNSNEPSVPIEHVWSQEDVERGWAAFEAARRL
jgi:hypothetical protein